MSFQHSVMMTLANTGTMDMITSTIIRIRKSTSSADCLFHLKSDITPKCYTAFPLFYSTPFSTSTISSRLIRFEKKKLTSMETAKTRIPDMR